MNALRRRPPLNPTMTRPLSVTPSAEAMPNGPVPVPRNRPRSVTPLFAVHRYAWRRSNPRLASPPTTTRPFAETASALPTNVPDGDRRRSVPLTQIAPRRSPTGESSQPTITEPSALMSLARLAWPSRLPRLTMPVPFVQRNALALQPSQPRPTTALPPFETAYALLMSGHPCDPAYPPRLFHVVPPRQMAAVRCPWCGASPTIAVPSRDTEIWPPASPSIVVPFPASQRK